MRPFLKSIAGLTAGLCLALCSPLATAAPQPSDSAIKKTMRKATQFMVETVSTNGGYVWSYLPDMSRRWGELEAKPSMIWVQPPGTATMGHLFLDAYHATGDEYYYTAAEKAAAALIFGQQDNGGWHYFIDFGGEASTKQWYDTIGKNAWRMEEFQHYWGNATYDDDGTVEAMTFILRLYLEKHDPKYKPSLDKAIDFVLKSQYPNGGWPQRYPLKYEFSHHGQPDYTSYITFNDDVAAGNVHFLILCYQALGETRVLDAINRGMNIYILAQNGAPQAGWALQYTPDLKPAGARTYEPKSLSAHTTASAIRQLMDFYKLTGDTKYLAPIPAALDWLDSVRLPGEKPLYPSFVELGTNKALYTHREGSNVVNGHYYADYNPEHTLRHYSSTRSINVAKLRQDYEKLKATPPEEASKDSPLKYGVAKPLPRYFLIEEHGDSDLNHSRVAETAGQLVKSLNKDGWWPTELKSTSNPYIGDGSPTPAEGDYRSTHVGDKTDTSPYLADKPVIGISTSAYIDNMKALIGALNAKDTNENKKK
ncbi:MAG: pectate lyase [Asticcacaulis sp.]|uniref:pectate lyase n=1 Tax=Asticcacaulis sp. TaxID=1872648 RepID=UPI0025C64026|nr:pectate lyase [Asticcacaulis sp.]MCA1936767.1 pectate lyase [Asticcacaulis sp.]